MQPLKNQIHKFLLKNKLTIAVAESCTGGMLSKSLTDTPGSSAYFVLGIVAYSNLAKKAILKIPAKVISENGAVSAAVALEMARQVKKIAGAALGIGITGIAGPAGGTVAKPVGTVFIAIAGQSKTISKKFRFRGSRPAIRQKAANTALKLLKCARLLP